MARGSVEYRVPPSRRYVKLTGSATLPLGVLLDTENGAVRLTSTVDGKPQAGTFSGGKFTVTQTATGMTELALAGPLALALIRRVVWAGAGRAARLKLETQNQKANWPAALLSGLQGELRLGRRGTAAGQDRAVQCRGTRHLG